MLQKRVRQPPNRAEIDRRARRHVLRKHADATFADAPAEAECAARAYSACWAALRAPTGCDAGGNGPTDRDGLGLRDADYVVPVVVGGGVEVGVGPDGIPEGLDDCFGGLVVPRGARAEAGAAAVDSEGGCAGTEEEGEGAEAQGGSEVMHFEGI